MEKISYQNLLDAGFTEEEAQKAFSDKLTAAGFSTSEVNSYIKNVSGKRPISLDGDEQNADITAFANTIDTVTQEARKEGVNLGFKDAIQRGWQQSVMGMLKNKQMPRELTPEEEKSLNFFERLAMGVSEVVSDTPIYLAGGKVGGLATGAAGAAIGTVAPGAGNLIGGASGIAIGGAAGAFGFHRAARAALIDMYQRGEVADFDELIYRVTHASKEFGKGAVVGGVTGGAGKIAGIGSKALAGAAVTRSGAAAVSLKAGAKTLPVGSEILGLTVAGSAVEGQVPTAQDFLDSATLILTLKGAHKITDVSANKLKNTVVDNLYKRFVENGEIPAEVMEKAAHDPVELQRVITGEKEQIKAGYEEVKQNPLKGTREGKDDVLATIQDGIKKYIVNRGAAIKNEEGDLIVKGDDLARETGTNDNFGFSKMIFKHGITVEEAQMLPEIVRYYEPVEKHEGNTNWRVPLDDKHNLIVAFAEKEGGINKEVTMFRERRNAHGKYEMSKKKDVAIPRPTLDSPAVDTNRGVYNPTPDSATSSTESIAKKAQEIKSQISPNSENAASATGGDYARDDYAAGKGGFAYRVKMPFAEKEALPEGKVEAKDAITKSSIIDNLKKAFDVPVRGWKIPRKGRGAKGIFSVKPEMIRVKFANDIATTAHELGHYLEKKMYGTVGSPEIVSYYDELQPLASKPRGGATKRSVAAEGFAQFISTYVVDPKTAKEKAPRFYEYFEKELKAKDPDILTALQAAQTQVEKFVKQPAVMEVLSNVSVREDGKTPLTTKEKWQAIKNYVKVKWFDDKAPLLRIVDQLEQRTGKKIDFSKNPYYLARLFPGWVGRAEAFIEHGTFDFRTLKDTGKSFKSIIEKAENLEELSAYLVSKRVLEIEGRNKAKIDFAWNSAVKEGKSPTEAMKYALNETIETGIRPEAARETVKALEGKYGKIAEELYAYQDALLKYQLDGGLISQETYDKVKAANKNRVPFYRVMDEEKDYAIGSKNMASKQVLKRMTGSTRTIIDPLEGIIRDTYETINAVERNRVGQALAELAETEGAGAFVYKLDTPMKSVKTVDGKETFVNSPNIEKDTQIKVFIDGKPQIYEVDKDVAALINGLNPSEANAALRMAKFFTNSLRAGATIYNIAFTIKNFMRDSIFAFLLTNSKYNPVKGIVGNAKAAIKKDEAYWQFKKAGGDQASFASVDRNSLQNEMKVLQNTGYAKSIWNLVKAKDFAAAWEAGVLEPLRFPGEVSELVTRLGEFKTSVKKYGKDKAGLEKAGFSARDITIDFAKAGIHGRAMNMAVAFFNANLQGLVKTGEVLTKHTAKALTFLGGLGIMEALANYDFEKGREDEDVAEVNRAQRNINYVFKVGDTIYRIPKPQQIGFVSTLFSQMTTAALDKLNKNQRDDLLRNVGQAFMNEVDISPMPNALGVPIELWANKSFFFDRPIVPASAEKLLPEYQYTQNTTELTKFISSKLGGWIGQENTFSPAKAEHVVRGWTGGVGTSILKASDLALRKLGIVPDPVKPAPTVGDIPFVKGFVIRHPSSNAESIQRFYDEYNSRMKKYNSFKAMAKQMNIGEMNELTPFASYGGLNSIYRGMSENGAAIRNIYNNPEMSADEKRQNIDQMYLIQIQLAKQGLETIKLIDSQVEEMKQAAKGK